MKESMKKSKRGPIVHDNFVIGTSRMINPLDAYRNPETDSRASAGCSGFGSSTDYSRDIDRWQRVHDQALDNAYTLLANDLHDASMAVDSLDIACDARIYIDRLKAKAKPSTWARVKAYWDGL